MSTDLIAGISEGMWTEKEAAHLLDVSLYILARWRRERRITFLQFPNGQIRYRRLDLENFLSASLRPSEGVKNGIPQINQEKKSGV